MQKRLLLLHSIIVAVLGEGGEKGAGVYDRLRDALKAAPANLPAFYRCVNEHPVCLVWLLRLFLNLPAKTAASYRGT